MADARTVGRDGGDGPVDSCGVCGGYGVPRLIFELRMSRRQRDGCGAMRASRVDTSLEAAERADLRRLASRSLFEGYFG